MDPAAERRSSHARALHSETAVPSMDGVVAQRTIVVLAVTQLSEHVLARSLLPRQLLLQCVLRRQQSQCRLQSAFRQHPCQHHLRSSQPTLLAVAQRVLHVWVAHLANVAAPVDGVEATAHTSVFCYGSSIYVDTDKYSVWNWMPGRLRTMW